MKLVTFTIAKQDFAADVRQVKEVIRIGEVVPIPDCPPWMEGIIHIRGEVLPLISLARKLRLPQGPDDANNRVIVSRRAQGAIGVVVDNVTSVITVEAEAITEPDDIVSQAPAIAAVGKVNGQLVPILNLDALIDDQESQAIPQSPPAVACQASAGGEVLPDKESL